MPGYTAYVSANGGEPVQGSNGSAKVTGPDSSMSIVVDYVADRSTSVQGIRRSDSGGGDQVHSGFTSVRSHDPQGYRRYHKGLWN